MLEVKNLPAKAGDAREVSLIPASGRFPGGGNGTPLQYSCLGNPADRGAWWAAVSGVTRVGHDLVTEPPNRSWQRRSNCQNMDRSGTLGWQGGVFPGRPNKMSKDPKMATHSSIVAEIIPWTEELGKV